MNLYEQFVFDECERRGLAAFQPYKDRGVDCIVTSKDFGGQPQRIQIKGSRTYQADGGGWYQITKPRFLSARADTDFWIFVSTKAAMKGRLQPVFIVVPTNDLYNRLIGYGSVSIERYNLYIAWDDPDHKGMVVDTRVRSGETWPILPSSLRDYTSYANNWQPLIAAVKP